MGYISCIGSCIACGKMMSFNPNKVPSYKGEPICKECVEKINSIRKERGITPLIPILEGAYDVADENDIDWKDD